MQKSRCIVLRKRYIIEQKSHDKPRQPSPHSLVSRKFSKWMFCMVLFSTISYEIDSCSNSDNSKVSKTNFTQKQLENSRIIDVFIIVHLLSVARKLIRIQKTIWENFRTHEKHPFLQEASCDVKLFAHFTMALVYIQFVAKRCFLKANA